MASVELRFSEETIRETVRRIAQELSRSYSGGCPVVVGVLKGSFIFLADLVRELTIPCEIDFIRARSYGAGVSSSGKVDIIKDVEIELRGRDVVVVEDIADSGLTLKTVIARLRSREPASLRCCALLVREGQSAPDFFGFTIGSEFVIGYGLDHAERYRGLREIYALTGERGRS